MRRAAAAILAVAVVASAFASTASSSRYLRVGIFDDNQVLFGVPDEVFPLLRSTNARVARVNLWWYGPTIAVVQRKPRRPADPADPAYKWTTYDRTVRYLSEIGVQPVFSVVGTPPWANKAAGWNVAPAKTADLRAFVAAAAKRYSGTYRSEEDDFLLPRVASWLAWNEPNNPVFLKPQFTRRADGSWQVQSAKDYAGICNAVVAGVKGVQQSAKVACGVTAPRGNNNPSSSRPSVSPLVFARALRAAGAKGFDAYAHHPYYGTRVETPSTPPARGERGQAPTAVNLGNIDTLIAEVNRLWGRKRIWITEYGYQTNPPDTFLGVTWKQQAQYLKEAVAIARAHPQIDMLIWFLLFDEVPPERWQSGLIAADGTRKPALAAFRSVAGGP